jgi:DnaJ-class molecular chaperone
VSGGLDPGDEAAPGTPGSGEDLCPHCGGSGEHDGVPCPVCGGTGNGGG